MDAEIDFNQLVVMQMNRCNLAYSEPNSATHFERSVRAFSCMLSHLKQKCDFYQKDMTTITIKHRKALEEIGNRKGMNDSIKRIKVNTSIDEYEALIRLCARNNLFPSKRGELNTDADW